MPAWKLRACCTAAALAMCVSAHSQWKYRDRKDPLTDKVERFAYVDSLNVHHFGFPHRGGTRARLTLIPREDGSTDLLFEVTRGQVICHSHDCVIRLRFDDGDADDYGGLPTADHSSNAAFITSETVFMDKVRTAKRLRIAATFYQEGVRVFEFRIPGLRWPEKAPTTP